MERFMPADSPPMTRTLADLTSEALIVPQLHGHDGAAVIQELTRVLHAAGRIKDMLAFYDAALNMELMHTSAMEYGIAFPHARMSDVESACFAFGRTRTPITWSRGSAAANVQLVFLLALPAIDAADYISVVLSLAHLHSEPENISLLMSASSARDILQTLRGIPIHTASIGQQ
jgi:mannitol/fructose-specific phosphotransferase system IIA component (Ntr-type)